uniref:Uncharacterized protein n=1 Tax=viral metagenome TaxID=1070528 RepID=A0A6H2A0G3_9ZZZZ
MIRFQGKKSLAGTFQPGDGTRYEMVAVDEGYIISVVVMNDDFFDKVTFPKDNIEFYTTYRNKRTNPWTIKAAKKMMDMLLEEEVTE